MKLYEMRTQTRQTQPAAVVRATLRVAEIGPWIGKAYGAVIGVITAQQISPAGPPFARYHRLGDDRFSVEAGFPVTAPIEAAGEVQPGELPGGPAVATVHVGPYDQMEPAYEALSGWVREHGGEPAGDPWEVYLTDTASEPDPAAWRTQIVQPYRAAAA